MMRLAPILACCLMLCGCAFGDGRGFATVDGTLTVEIGEEEFNTAGGKRGRLESVEVELVQLQMEGDTEVEGGIEHRTSVLPIIGSFNPVAQTSSAPFGPYEVDRGDYVELNCVINRLVVQAKVGDELSRIEVVPAGGIRVTARAELPANRDRAPIITITARLILPDTLMADVDLSDEDAAAARIAANISTEAVLDATWVRKAD